MNYWKTTENMLICIQYNQKGDQLNMRSESRWRCWIGYVDRLNQVSLLLIAIKLERMGFTLLTRDISRIDRYSPEQILLESELLFGLLMECLDVPTILKRDRISAAERSRSVLR